MKHIKNTKQKYTVVFILRKINDMDHLLPLICKFHNTGHLVRVITLGIDKIDNYLVDYMFSKTGLLVETPVLDNINSFFRFLVFIFNKAKKFFRSNNLYFLLKYLEYMYSHIKRYVLKHEDLKDNVCSGILDCNNTNVVITDKTNIFRNKIYRNITKHASINNIPIIRIDHGFYTMVVDEDLMGDSKILLPDMKDKVFDTYHSVIELYRISHDIRSSKISEFNKLKEIGKEEIKTFVLGNMRFSKKWVNEYKEIQKFDTTEDLEINTKNHTILLILSPVEHIYIDKFVSLLNSIASKFDVNIIYKPHTRRDKIDTKIKNTLNKEVEMIYSYKGTVALMDVADLVLLCGVSSVAMHPVVDSTPIIFAEYICKHVTYYSKYMGEYTSMYEYDVRTKIEDIFNNKMDFSKNKGSDRIIRELVNPNDSDDIIQDYFDLACDIVENHNKLSLSNITNIRS